LIQKVACYLHLRVWHGDVDYLVLFKSELAVERVFVAMHSWIFDTHIGQYVSRDAIAGRIARHSVVAYENEMSSEKEVSDRTETHKMVQDTTDTEHRYITLPLHVHYTA
jgi:hypothetical protein